MAKRAVSIAELKNNLGVYLGRVRRGGEILVQDRDVPIARIIPFSAPADVNADQQELAAEGKLRLPSNELPASFWRSPAPSLAADDVLRVLRADRDHD